MSKPDICIYHGNCADGFTAAWAIWRRWPDVEFVAGVYGAPPPDVAGKHVLLVDFSYKRPVLEELSRSARSVTVLDHHKSAEADLAAFVVDRYDFELTHDDFADMCQFMNRHPIRALFDMGKSGAMLAWEYAHPDQRPPALVEYVQDRDLWKFEKPHSREIAAALFSHEYSFENWDAAYYELADDFKFYATVDQGRAIERKHHKDVAELLRVCTREMIIGGHRVKVANMPYTLSSDGAGALAEGAPFGACYFDNAEGKRVFSLRSRDGGVDVSEIAAGYGGGGHARAAGFTAPAGWEGEAA